MESVGTVWLWLVLTAFVVLAVAVDLLVLRVQGAHRVSRSEALRWTLLWVALALVFCAGLWLWLDHGSGRAMANLKATEFLTGYLIEKSLSIDNIFVFLMLFTYFGVPSEFQKRVIVLGVVGAIVLRALMILLGALLISRFHWILYLFGVFLLTSGIKMLWFADASPDLERNPVLQWMRRHLRITDAYHGEQLTLVREGQRWVTPLFAVLVLVAVTDIIFAVDSIPAVYAVTRDPFIVMSANVFAVLGMRALYFLLADMKERFHLLTYGLALVLIFVGTKMLLAGWIKVSPVWSLGVVLGVLVASVVISVLAPPAPPQAGMGLRKESEHEA